MRSYRKFVTSSVAVTFVVVGMTGVIFKLFFKNHALEEIHGWLGLAMVAAAIFHVIQNWGSLRRHLRDRRVYALLVPVALVCALFAGQSEPARGINPRRVIHKLTEASVQGVAKALGKDPNQAFAAMKGDGLQAGSAAETIQQLADENHQPPERILSYFAM
jgi:hypothetical protein